MNLTPYLHSEVRDESGQSRVGTADLWEDPSSSLRFGTFFPDVWSKQTKEILDCATELKLKDGRKFILAALEKKEHEKGGGYYKFRYQPI